MVCVCVSVCDCVWSEPLPSFLLSIRKSTFKGLFSSNFFLHRQSVCFRFVTDNHPANYIWNVLLCWVHIRGAFGVKSIHPSVVAAPILHWRLMTSQYTFTFLLSFLFKYGILNVSQIVLSFGSFPDDLRIKYTTDFLSLWSNCFI